MNYSQKEPLHLRCVLFTRPKDVLDFSAVPEEFLQPLFFALFLSRGSQRWGMSRRCVPFFFFFFFCEQVNKGFTRIMLETG